MHYKQLSRSAEQQSDAYRGFRCKVKYVTFVCARPRTPVSDTANVPGPQCADRHFAESGRPRTHLVEHFCFVLACWRRQDFSKARHGCYGGASAPIVDRIAKSSVVVSKLEMHSKLARSAIALSNLPNP